VKVPPLALEARKAPQAIHTSRPERSALHSGSSRPGRTVGWTTYKPAATPETHTDLLSFDPPEQVMFES
jgi:hypothetical protein